MQTQLFATLSQHWEFHKNAPYILTRSQCIRLLEPFLYFQTQTPPIKVLARNAFSFFFFFFKWKSLVEIPERQNETPKWIFRHFPEQLLFRIEDNQNHVKNVRREITDSDLPYFLTKGRDWLGSCFGFLRSTCSNARSMAPKTSLVRAGFKRNRQYSVPCDKHADI